MAQFEIARPRSKRRTIAKVAEYNRRLQITTRRAVDSRLAR
jgi:hypothetical protein